MDSIEKNSIIAITTVGTIFALDFVLPEKYRCLEKASYKNFLFMTAACTVGGVFYDLGKEMWKKKATSGSSPTLSSTLSASS